MITHLLILDDLKVKILVKLVLFMVASVLIEVEVVLEQILGPAAMLRQPHPHGIRINLSFNELLPELAIGDNAEPFLANQLCGTERLGVQIGKNYLSDEEKALGRQRGNKISLEHWLQEVVDVAMLEVTHSSQKVLGEFYLFNGRPVVK